jgi:Scramblase
MLTPSNSLEVIGSANTLFVKQHEDALRIFTGWQTLNHYSIMDGEGRTWAALAERHTGFLSTLSRLFFRNRRPLKIDIFDSEGKPIAVLERPWYWFFSDLYVYDGDEDTLLGMVRRRFGFWLPKYDLCDGNNRLFGRLRCPLLGGATLGGSLLGNRNYNVFDTSDRATGTSIMRTWNGLMRIFTDEDTYCVEFSEGWTAEQRLIILSAAISIDFDSFETDKSAIGEGESIVGSVANIMGSINSNDN